MQGFRYMLEQVKAKLDKVPWINWVSIDFQYAFATMKVGFNQDNPVNDNIKFFFELETMDTGTGHYTFSLYAPGLEPLESYGGNSEELYIFGAFRYISDVLSEHR